MGTEGTLILIIVAIEKVSTLSEDAFKMMFTLNDFHILNLFPDTLSVMLKSRNLVSRYFSGSPLVIFIARGPCFRATMTLELLCYYVDIWSVLVPAPCRLPAQTAPFSDYKPFRLQTFTLPFIPLLRCCR